MSPDTIRETSRISSSNSIEGIGLQRTGQTKSRKGRDSVRNGRGFRDYTCRISRDILPVITTREPGTPSYGSVRTTTP